MFLFCEGFSLLCCKCSFWKCFFAKISHFEYCCLVNVLLKCLCFLQRCLTLSTAVSPDLFWHQKVLGKYFDWAERPLNEIDSKASHCISFFWKVYFPNKPLYIFFWISLSLGKIFLHAYFNQSLSFCWHHLWESVFTLDSLSTLSLICTEAYYEDVIRVYRIFLAIHGQT